MNKKRKVTKCFASWILGFVMVLTTINLPMFSIAVKAAECDGVHHDFTDLIFECSCGAKNPGEGNCGAQGSDVRYTLVRNKDGATYTLGIFGEGQMSDVNNFSLRGWNANAGKITHLKVAEGVTYIGSRSFYLNSVQTIELPSSLEDAGESVFFECKNLESISGSSTGNIRVENNAIIKGSELILGCKNTVIPEGVTAIGKLAFYNQKGLNSITIPSSVETIDEGAFWGTSLKSIEFPKKTINFPGVAFFDCADLKEIVFHNDVINELKPGHAFSFLNPCNVIIACDSSLTVDGVKAILPDKGMKFTVSKDAHNYIAEVNASLENQCIKEETCGVVGTYKKYCSKCNDLSDETFEVSATGEHDFSAKDVKKATVTANGKITTKCKDCGEVSGTKTIYYPKTYTLEKTSYEYTGSQIKPVITVKDCKGNVVDAKYYTVSYGTNKAVGKGTVDVDFKGNYTGSKTVEFEITPKKTTIGTPAIATDGITVKWTKNTSAKGYIIYRSVNSAAYEKIKTISDNTVVSWKDTSANVNGSKYQYKIVAYKVVDGVNYKSGYSSVKTRYFVSQPVIASLSNGAAGKMTLKWDKNQKATGYQIQYSTDSSFATYKTSNVTSNATVSRTFSGLTKGSKYYVRIRSYKEVGDTKYYSAWSSKKSVTIAK